MSSNETPSAEQRLFELVHRELGAREVTIEPAFDEAAADELTLGARLTDDRWVVARFAEPPEDRAAIERRMAILISAFSHLLERETRRPPARVPPAQSLKGELAALAKRAGALDAIVIDAHSPVVWGSARGYQGPAEVSAELAEILRLVELTRSELEDLVKRELEALPRVSEPPQPANSDGTEPQEGSHELDDEAAARLTAAAIERVRELPEFPELRRGRPLRARDRERELGWVVHSFASIYLLLLVFDGHYDELRAERAIHDALGRIERLVIALPPRDPSPSPMGNVVRLPRRR